MVSPAPPDFFAESAKNPDHIVDANKMVPAGLPSVDEIEAEIRPMSYEGADLTECVSRILDLIRPAFEAKEREIEVLDGERAIYFDMAAKAQDRALDRAKDEIVRTADDLSIHSPTVKLVEEIAAIIGQPALNSRAIVREAARAAARGEKGHG